MAWADFGPVVIGPIQEREAALVLEAAHRVGPEVPPAQIGPHEIVDLVVGRPRELVGSLVAVGAGRPVDDGAERRMLRAATRATLAVAGVERCGWGWRTSWAAGVAVVDAAGNAVPLEQWVDLAVERPVDGDALHRSLGEWGLARGAPRPPATAPTTPGRGPDRIAASSPPPVAAGPAPIAGSAPTGRSAPVLMPPPDVRGVEPVEPPWVLAGTFGGSMRTVRLAVAPDRLAVGDDVVAFAEVTSISFKVVRQNAAVGPLTSGTWTLELTTATGKAKLKLNITATEAREAFEAVYAWLLGVLEQTVVRRLVAEAVAAVRAGGAAEVAGLRVAATGATPPGRRAAPVPWASVDVAAYGEGLVIVTAVGARRPFFSTPTATPNAAVIPPLVTELATLYR